LRLLIIFAVCLAALLYFRTDPRFEGARSVLVDVSAGVYVVANAPRDAWDGLARYFSSRAALRDENQRLRQENLVIKGQTQRLNAVLAENARYRALLNSAQIVENQVMVAEVVAVASDPTRHLLILDKGQGDGVAVGQPLLGAQGLMGQVVAVGEGSSRALLITDVTHAIPVQIARNGIRAIAEGTGDVDQLVVRHIAATTDIRIGDTLVSSGLGGRFPPGYPVAEVTVVDLPPGASFATVSARPLAQLDRGRHVLVAVTPGVESP